MNLDGDSDKRSRQYSVCHTNKYRCNCERENKVLLARIVTIGVKNGIEGLRTFQPSIIQLESFGRTTKVLRAATKAVNMIE